MDDTRDPLDPHTVHDRESFFAFVRALAADRRASVTAERQAPNNPSGPQAGGWENATIESFLGAALAWAEDTDMGVRQGRLPVEPSWRAFAVFLHCGKIYE